MKYIKLIFFIALFYFKLSSQTYQFTTIKKDSNLFQINTVVILEKDSKKIYVNSTFKNTFLIKRYSVASKYQLMECKDSLTNKSFYVEIYTGIKETFMSTDDGKGNKLLYK